MQECVILQGSYYVVMETSYGSSRPVALRKTARAAVECCVKLANRAMDVRHGEIERMDMGAIYRPESIAFTAILVEDVADI